MNPPTQVPSRPSAKLLIAIAAVGLLVALLWARPWEGVVAVDLVADLPKAIEQRPEPRAFSAIDAIQNGVWKKSIYVTQPSRLVYRLDGVPARAWLQVDMGIKESAWWRPNHGVLFVVSVKPDGARLREMISIVINPFSNEADRQWQPVKIDLTPWAGQSLDVYLETRAPHEGADLQNHLPLWGAPAIITR